jgi:hypothetical protein
MKKIFLMLILLCLTAVIMLSYPQLSNQISARQSILAKSKASSIIEIPLPVGFERIALTKDSFGEWLRNFRLKKDNIVRLYNGQPKERQDLHYAVLDLSTGNKNLQQCADAIMRLKAEYYFARKEYSQITFPAGKGKMLSFDAYALEHSTCFTHGCFLNFMEKVFIQCGTYTIDAMTRPVQLSEIQPGDVIVKAGAPGHAMIVVDVAENRTTHQRIYLLAQSFMPAQDMHIVINPMNQLLSPWYTVNENAKVITPGWVFETYQLKRWK